MGNGEGKVECENDRGMLNVCLCWMIEGQVCMQFQTGADLISSEFVNNADRSVFLKKIWWNLMWVGTGRSELVPAQQIYVHSHAPKQSTNFSNVESITFGR